MEAFPQIREPLRTLRLLPRCSHIVLFDSALEQYRDGLRGAMLNKKRFAQIRLMDYCLPLVLCEQVDCWIETEALSRWKIAAEAKKGEIVKSMSVVGISKPRETSWKTILSKKGKFQNWKRQRLVEGERRMI